MSKLTTEEIEAILARAEKATAGPWRASTTKLHKIPPERQYVVISWELST